jgi:hypothetical protein
MPGRLVLDSIEDQCDLSMLTEKVIFLIVTELRVVESVWVEKFLIC